MLHTFAIYVDNKPGVLNRVSSLFRRRAFNIESLTVGHTETPGVSRMTVVVDTDDDLMRRVVLETEAREVLIEPVAATTHRLQHGDGRQGGPRGVHTPATRQELQRRPEGDELKGPARDHAQEDERGEQRHVRPRRGDPTRSGRAPDRRRSCGGAAWNQ